MKTPTKFLPETFWAEMIESVVGGLPGRHRRSKVESLGARNRHPKNREQLTNNDHVVAQPLHSTLHGT
jgi:hypothetical protein